MINGEFLYSTRRINPKLIPQCIVFTQNKIFSQHIPSSHFSISRCQFANIFNIVGCGPRYSELCSNVLILIFNKLKQITFEIYSSSRSCRLETEEKEGEFTHILPKSNKLTVIAIVSYSFHHQNNLDNHKKVAWRLELIPASYSENISQKQCSLILVLVVC